jgi:hypothetical protein
MNGRCPQVCASTNTVCGRPAKDNTTHCGIHNRHLRLPTRNLREEYPREARPTSLKLPKAQYYNLVSEEEMKKGQSRQRRQGGPAKTRDKIMEALFTALCSLAEAFVFRFEGLGWKLKVEFSQAGEAANGGEHASIGSGSLAIQQQPSNSSERELSRPPTQTSATSSKTNISAKVVCESASSDSRQLHNEARHFRSQSYATPASRISASLKVAPNEQDTTLAFEATPPYCRALPLRDPEAYIFRVTLPQWARSSIFGAGTSVRLRQIWKSKGHKVLRQKQKQKARQ